MPRRPGSRLLARRLGARIRALRQEAGLTQEALAWSCELAKPFLSQMEAGKRLPSVPVLAALARRLGVEMADLVALDPRNDRLRLLEACRLADWPAAATVLRRLGADARSDSDDLLRVAEPTRVPAPKRQRGK